jgi:ribosomal protein L24
MAKQKMFKFNVKNAKYATITGGVYDAPLDLAYAEGLALEADYNETKLYGDGEVLVILGDDKGKTGTLSVINIEQDYEKACGRAEDLDVGIADVQQRESVEHAIYYEVEAVLDGVTITIKNWMYGVTTGKAGETYEQTKDDPTINTYDYPLTVLGTNLRNNGDTADEVDVNGNTKKVFRLTVYPGDTGYDTFEDAVVIPKAAL